MSLGTRMSFGDAYGLAEEVSERLGPTVDHLKAVGSLRRRRDTVGDIEFLARPHSTADLFGGATTVHLPEVREAMYGLGTWIKGGPRMMQVTDLLGRLGTRLELYLVHPGGCTCKDCSPWGPAAWGSMLAIRTGPEDLGKYCVSRMRERGFRHAHGHVRELDSGKIVATDIEEDFFRLAGVECLSPRLRDEQAAGLWETYSTRNE